MTDTTPPHDTVEETTRGRRSPRRAAIVGARVVTGTVGIGVAAVAIVAASFLPIPTVAGSPVAEEITPVPTAQELVCAGGILRLGDASGQDAETATSIGRPIVTSDSSAGTLDIDALDGAEGNSSAPQSLRAAPGSGEDDDESVLLAGAQSEVAALGEFRGLAASACASVATDVWLAGGATMTGRTTLVSIANPSDVIATVSIAVAGEEGEIEATGGSDIIIQPKAQRVIPLAGLAPELESPVVHVTSRGGQVVATLQQSIVRGLEPGGVEIIGTTARPSTRQVIPGVVIGNSVQVGSKLGQQGFDDLTSVLRVFVPGADDTTVDVGIVAEDGTAAGASFTFDVEAGLVTDLPIEELADGTYTLLVESGEPIVASLRVSTVASRATADGLIGSDFAWFAAATELTDDTLVSIAQGPRPKLHIANPGAGSIEVEVEDLSGSTTTVTVPGQSTVATPVTGGRSYRLSGLTSAWASVSYFGQGQLAAYSVQPPAVTSSDITIYP